MDNDINTQTQIDVKKEVKQIVGRLPKYIKLAWLVVKDPGLTAKQRTILLGAIGYSVSPLDLIPGVIPVIGQMDDLALFIWAVRWILSTMPKDKASDYLSRSDLTMEILDTDLDMVKRSGVRILKKATATIGVAALGIWGMVKLISKSTKNKNISKKNLHKSK